MPYSGQHIVLLCLFTWGHGAVKADPCKTHENITDVDLLTNHSYIEDPGCDRTPSSPDAAWYRYTVTPSGAMATFCPEVKSCGGKEQIWINDNLPVYSDGKKYVRACIRTEKSCCDNETKIFMKNCGTFYVVVLTRPPTCHTHYCFDATIPESSANKTTLPMTPKLISGTTIAPTTSAFDSIQLTDVMTPPVLSTTDFIQTTLKINSSKPLSSVTTPGIETLYITKLLTSRPSSFAANSLTFDASMPLQLNTTHIATTLVHRSNSYTTLVTMASTFSVLSSEKVPGITAGTAMPTKISTEPIKQNSLDGAFTLLSPTVINTSDSAMLLSVSTSYPTTQAIKDVVKVTGATTTVSAYHKTKVTHQANTSLSTFTDQYSIHSTSTYLTPVIATFTQNTIKIDPSATLLSSAASQMNGTSATAHSIGIQENKSMRREENDKDSLSVYTGLGILGLLLLVSVVLIALFVRHRKRRRRKMSTYPGEFVAPENDKENTSKPGSNHDNTQGEIFAPEKSKENTSKPGSHYVNTQLAGLAGTKKEDRTKLDSSYQDVKNSGSLRYNETGEKVAKPEFIGGNLYLTSVCGLVLPETKDQVDKPVFDVDNFKSQSLITSPEDDGFQ